MARQALGGLNNNTDKELVKETKSSPTQKPSENFSDLSVKNILKSAWKSVKIAIIGPELTPEIKSLFDAARRKLEEIYKIAKSHVETRSQLDYAAFDLNHQAVDGLVYTMRKIFPGKTETGAYSDAKINPEDQEVWENLLKYLENLKKSASHNERFAFGQTLRFFDQQKYFKSQAFVSALLEALAEPDQKPKDKYDEFLLGEKIAEGLRFVGHLADMGHPTIETTEKVGIKILVGTLIWLTTGVDPDVLDKLREEGPKMKTAADFRTFAERLESTKKLTVIEKPKL